MDIHTKSKDDLNFPSQNPFKFFKKYHFSPLYFFLVLFVALALLLSYNSSFTISSTTTHIFTLQSFTTSSPSKAPQRVGKNGPFLPPPGQFSNRVRQFFDKNSCEVRVFMTWISPNLDSFKDKERFTIESLFKFNPNACLIIVSESMDSPEGEKILSPFTGSNFRVMPVNPDYPFILNETVASAWFDRMKRGDVKPGKIALGVHLSDLLRLALLYKYGGIYMDTDFIVLKRLDELRNSVGIQTVDENSGNWTSLNGALMVFDKKHPLLNRFIEEFAFNFNGDVWGETGPYLVSRVIDRVNNNKEGVDFNFTILPLAAFYPVNWTTIGSLFETPKDEVEKKWVESVSKQIDEETYALHLWNQLSRDLVPKDGSMISRLMKRACIFCNSSTKTSKDNTSSLHS